MMPQYPGLGPGYVLVLVRGAVSAKDRRRAECRLSLIIELEQNSKCPRSVVIDFVKYHHDFVL